MSEDTQLLELFLKNLLNGDREAVVGLRSVIDRYLHRFGGHRCADPENLNAEIVSAVVHNLQKGVFRGDNLRQFNAYVRAIVLNTVLKETQSEAKIDVLPDLDHTPSGKNGEDAAIADKDMVRYVLERMQPQCRELLTMKYLQDLSNAEIAEKLKLREVTVRVRIYRCTECAKQVMKDNGIL